MFEHLWIAGIFSMVIALTVAVKIIYNNIEFEEEVKKKLKR